MPKCRSPKRYGETYKCTNEATHRVRHLDTLSKYVIAVCKSHVRMYNAINEVQRQYHNVVTYETWEIQ